MPKGNKATFELKAPPTGLAFSDTVPRAFGASPYRAALEQLAAGTGQAARFKDTGAARSSLKKWSEQLRLAVRYAKEGDYLWVRVETRVPRRNDVDQPGGLDAAVLQAVRETPRTGAEVISRVTKWLDTSSKPEEIRTALKRLLAAGTIKKTEDDLKYEIAGGKRGR